MLTTDQVTALAPDAASYKAGRALATARKWSGLGKNDSALWGLAAGSGKKPYYTQVDLSDLATKCSCPSRKFPCKHALGLLFLAAESPDDLSETETPDWVTEWLTTRAEKATKKAARKAAKKSPNPAAAQKRKAQRAARIDSGVTLLSQFLRDTLANGLARPEIESPAYWEDQASRLIDAQAPGLANQVRALSDLPHSGPDWHQTLLHRLGHLHLLLESYQKRETLSPDLRATVSQLIGWPVEKDEVLAGKGHPDHWFAATRQLTRRDQLTTSATWFYGLNSHRWALTLNFGAASQMPIESTPLGQLLETSFHYYPGAHPERALPAPESKNSSPKSLPTTSETFPSLLERAAQNLAQNPFLTRTPFLLYATPLPGKTPALQDSEGKALPIRHRQDQWQRLLILSAGHPLLLAGEWDGRQLHLHSAADGSHWTNLNPISL